MKLFYSRSTARKNKSRMTDEGTVSQLSGDQHPVLDTTTVSLDEPNYSQMKENRRNRTKAVMKVR